MSSACEGRASPRISFGNWSSGGDWGGVDRPAAIAAARQALDLGITFFDTARAVRDGQAAILVGGETGDVDRATAVLSAVGQVRHVGPLGSAARLKLVANSMLADLILSAAELQVAGEAAGLDPDDVCWALERLVAALGIRRAVDLRTATHRRSSPCADLGKDLDLALALFRTSAVDVPLTTLVESSVTEASGASGLLDITSVIRAYRRAAPPPRSTPLDRTCSRGADSMTARCGPCSKPLWMVLVDSPDPLGTGRPASRTRYQPNVPTPPDRAPGASLCPGSSGTVENSVDKLVDEGPSECPA